MRLIPLAALALVAACSGEPFQAELLPCRCEAEACAADECFIDVAFDESCDGQLEDAEVWVDGHVEAELVSPGAATRLCSRIPLGASAEVAVRGGPWIWGPLTERCEAAASTRSVVLRCVDAEAP